MKIGDKVRFLNEVGGGVVTGFQGKNIVLVEDTDGFEIPVAVNEVVVIETKTEGSSHFSQKREERETKTSTVSYNRDKDAGSDKASSQTERVGETVVSVPTQERRGGDVLSAYIAFVPVDIKEITHTQFEAYLVNDSNYFLDFTYLSAEGSNWKMRAHGRIEPNTKLFLEEFERDVLNEMERLCVQFVAYKRDKFFMLKSPVSAQFRIDAVKFYKLHTFQENDFFESPALLYTLIENDKAARPLVIDAQQLKKEMFQKKETAPQGHTYVRRYENGKGNPFAPKHGDNIVVVDLHAHELLETTAGMSAGDILNHQLGVFRKTMEEYLQKKGQKIVFIHGKGEGVLRKAVVHELTYRYKSCHYQDASFQEYGYGATQVTIK